MKFEDYKKLFKPKIIMFVKGTTMLKNIEKIERRDKDFHKLNNYCKVLKYSIRKQMKKERN